MNYPTSSTHKDGFIHRQSESLSHARGLWFNAETHSLHRAIGHSITKLLSDVSIRKWAFSASPVQHIVFEFGPGVRSPYTPPVSSHTYVFGCPEVALDFPVNFSPQTFQ